MAVVHIPNIALSLLIRKKLPESDIPFVLKHLNHCNYCMDKPVANLPRPVNNMLDLILYEGEMMLLVRQEAATMVGYMASA